MLWALVPVGYAIGVRRDVLLLGLAVACVVAIVVEITRIRSATVRTVFHRTTGSLLREHEHHRWSGATWLLISFLLVTALFDAPIAITAMWAVAMGDASAAIVGRTIGRHRIGTFKTLEGSIACVAVTMVGAMVIADLPFGAAAAGAIAAALAEWPSRPFDDNARIGLATGIGILLCRMAFS